MFDKILNAALQWQTLIAGMIALFAAWLTVRAIGRQIKLQERQLSADEQRYRDEQRRKSQRARAMLPDALSAIGAYASECVRYVSADSSDFPRPPESDMNAIKGAIEFADSGAAESLIELVNFYQVHNSRLSNLTQNRRRAEEVERLYDAVRLRFLGDRMYAYARNESSADSRSPHDQMISALRSCVGISMYFEDEGRWSEVIDLIDRRHPRG